MQLPRSFAAALWVAVTAASTGMVWVATSIVAADVTDRPAKALAHQEVVGELASGSAPTTTTPKADGAAPTVPPDGRGPAPGNGSPNKPVPGGAPSPAQSGEASATPSSPPANATAPAPSTGSAPAAPATSPTSSRPSATYSTSGGVVRVACSSFFFIELVSAIPSNGYSVDVVAAGPANVEVHFIGSGQDVSVQAVCFGQPIRYYGQTAPKRAPASP